MLYSSNLNTLWSVKDIFYQIILYRYGIVQSIFRINNNPNMVLIQLKNKLFEVIESKVQNRFEVKYCFEAKCHLHLQFCKKYCKHLEIWELVFF